LLTGSSDLPAGFLSACGGNARAEHTGILGLAGGGVCRADSVTKIAVRSYRTFSPLPEGCVFSVALSRPAPTSYSRHKPNIYPILTVKHILNVLLNKNTK